MRTKKRKRRKEDKKEFWYPKRCWLNDKNAATLETERFYSRVPITDNMVFMRISDAKKVGF